MFILYLTGYTNTYLYMVIGYVLSGKKLSKLTEGGLVKSEHGRIDKRWQEHETDRKLEAEGADKNRIRII